VQTVSEKEIDLFNLNWCEVKSIPQCPIESNDIDILYTVYDVVYDLINEQINEKTNNIENIIHFVPYWWAYHPYYKHLYSKENKTRYLTELIAMLETLTKPEFNTEYKRFPWVRYKDYSIIIKPKIWIDMDSDVSHIIIIYNRTLNKDDWCTIGYLLYNHKIFRLNQYYYNKLVNVIK